jgi:hypothetical protein
MKNNKNNKNFTSKIIKKIINYIVYCKMNQQD